VAVEHVFLRLSSHSKRHSSLPARCTIALTSQHVVTLPVFELGVHLSAPPPQLTWLKSKEISLRNLNVETIIPFRF
jgi:hypothetical protein